MAVDAATLLPATHASGQDNRMPQPYVTAVMCGVAAVALLDQGCLPANLLSEGYWRRIKDRVPEGTVVEYQGLEEGTTSVPFATARVPCPEDEMIPERRFAPEDSWIRLVTDYSWLTPNLSVPKHLLKHVKDSLAFMTSGDSATGEPFGSYCDLDMMASFHQIKIDDPSSDRLSVVSPWGQYRPRFLPEGIAPATAILQKTVDRVFSRHKDRLLCIYDNLLLAGTTYEDMFDQLKKVLTTCRENNMILKFTKCWFGAKQVKFFGYICTTEKYGWWSH